MELKIKVESDKVIVDKVTVDIKAPEKVTVDKVSVDKVTADKVTVDKVASERVTLGKVTADIKAPARAVPAGAVPARAVPARAVPAGVTPARAVPARAVPAGAVPARAVPAGVTPARVTPNVVNAAPLQKNVPQKKTKKLQQHEEPKSSAHMFKTTLCKFWLRGACSNYKRFVDGCPFAHGAHELRPYCGHVLEDFNCVVPPSELADAFIAFFWRPSLARIEKPFSIFYHTSPHNKSPYIGVFWPWAVLNFGASFAIFAGTVYETSAVGLNDLEHALLVYM